MDASASQKIASDDARSPGTQDHNEYHQNGTLEPKSEESLESQPQSPPVDENIVGWDGPNDPKNPFTWSFKYKLFVSAVLNSLPLVVNIGSSILSDASRPLSKEYHVGTEVDILTITLFLLGFTFGPLIFGPLSEKFGRRWPILTGVTPFATFCLPVALAQNFQTIMISRFFSGLFGSSMAITGGTLTDIWATPISRGITLDVFVTTGFIGPVIGPVVGSFITQSYLGWRWTMWVTAIVAYSFAIIAFFSLPETYGPVLLTRKAGRLRYETKNWAIHSKMEEDRQDFQSLLRIYLLRPWGKQNFKTPNPYTTARALTVYSPLSNRTHPRPNNALPLLPLRPALPLLRSLSNLLPRRPALEAANRRSRLPGHPRRQPTRPRRRRHALSHHIRPPDCIHSRRARPRAPPPAHDCRRRPPPHRPLLVRLDVAPRHALASTSGSRDPCRGGYVRDFHPGLQVHRRRVSGSGQLGHLCEYVCA